MSAYDRGQATEFREIDRWLGGVGWLAHPTELGERASHAMRGEGGHWVIDPLDAPGIDGLLDEFGDVFGMAIVGGVIGGLLAGEFRTPELVEPTES